MDLNEEAIIKEHYGRVKLIASRFSLNPVETEDLIQEGLIGLLSAARNYREGCGASFNTYSYRCIYNRMLDSIKFRSEEQLPEDYDSADSSGTPEERLMLREYLSSVLESLSDYEFSVFNLMMDGYTNAMISEKLGKPISSVYNASQRIRQKLAAELN